MVIEGVVPALRLQSRHCQIDSALRHTDDNVTHAGSRVRYVIYAAGLTDKVDIKSPGELGGLKSDEYKGLHPMGKMPLLVLPSGQAIPESTVRIAPAARLHAQKLGFAGRIALKVADATDDAACAVAAGRVAAARTLCGNDTVAGLARRSNRSCLHHQSARVLAVRAFPTANGRRLLIAFMFWDRSPACS